MEQTPLALFHPRRYKAHKNKRKIGIFHPLQKVVYTSIFLESANSVLNIAGLLGSTVIRIGRRCENISSEAMITSLTTFSSLSSVLGNELPTKWRIWLIELTELHFAIPIDSKTYING